MVGNPDIGTGLGPIFEPENRLPGPPSASDIDIESRQQKKSSPLISNHLQPFTLIT
jgi:hypothetical protein